MNLLKEEVKMTKDFKKRFLLVILLLVLYIPLFVYGIGWRADHGYILAIMIVCILAHTNSYGVVLALAGFILFWISYESLTMYPNYMVNPVNVLEPYQLELAWFGMLDDGVRVIPCEWFATRTSDILSLVAGFSYILWMPAPMMYAIYLLVVDKPILFDFTFGFLLTCLMAYIFYYTYPAAPPWYYLEYGNGTDFTIPGSEGLLSEFDRLVGAPIFKGIYAKGGNVFCAIPSLHSAYPVLCMMIALLRKTYWMALVFFIWGLGTWFAAVYSQHHYVIDILLGIVCAFVGLGLIRYLQRYLWMRGVKSWFLSEVGH